MGLHNFEIPADVDSKGLGWIRAQLLHLRLQLQLRLLEQGWVHRLKQLRQLEQLKQPDKRRVSVGSSVTEMAVSTT